MNVHSVDRNCRHQQEQPNFLRLQMKEISTTDGRLMDGHLAHKNFSRHRNTFDEKQISSMPILGTAINQRSGQMNLWLLALID
jgi:hypothetical protein